LGGTKKKVLGGTGGGEKEWEFHDLYCSQRGKKGTPH